MTNAATQSFDRMRSMLLRAAEIRDSEQQQIFDALDEIHARLAPLESLGSVRKRLTELPDRTEISVLTGRMDEVLAKLEAQDGAIAALSRSLESIVDKLATSFAELGSRLDVLSGALGALEGALAQRPDVDSLSGLVRQANEESELRYTAQLDEAMATFAEIIMGGGAPAALPPTAPPPPRPAQRRARARQTKPVEDGGILADAAS